MEQPRSFYKVFQSGLRPRIDEASSLELEAGHIKKGTTVVSQQRNILTTVPVDENLITKYSVARVSSPEGASLTISVFK